MNRLETLSADLTAKLHRASPEKQRAASLAACELAVAKARVEHSLVNEALRLLRGGNLFTHRKKAELDDLVAQLDQEYFSLQEAADAAGTSTDDYLLVFAKARAVAALSFAGCGTRGAAAESIYEAAAAVGDDKQELFSLIASALK